MNFKRPLCAITTTLPVEVPYAAGWSVVDLNNLFVTSPNPQSLVEQAEQRGFPKTFCAWIKGIYTVCRNIRPDLLLAVSGGDCTNTRVMAEILESEGIPVHHFAFPYPRDKAALREEIERLCRRFGVSLADAQRAKKRLDRIRLKLEHLEKLTWQTHQVTGGENHQWLVSASDFRSDPDRFEEQLTAFLKKAESRPHREVAIRLAYTGVPPILTDFYDFFPPRDADIVFNETQRQFACIPPVDDLIEQYHNYTYPYAFAGRLRDILDETARRNCHGIIYYTQTFCFRQACEIMLREATAQRSIPLLALEADIPGPLSAQHRTRLEAFLEMLSFSV